eukprot:4325502-Pyramimonas_sp.AAC.1
MGALGCSWRLLAQATRSSLCTLSARSPVTGHGGDDNGDDCSGGGSGAEAAFSGVAARCRQRRHR